MSKTFSAEYAAFVAIAAANGYAVTLVPLGKQPKAASPKSQPKAEKPARKASSKSKTSKGTKLYSRYCDAVGIEYPDIEAEYKAAKQPLYRRDGKAIAASTKCHWHHTQHPELLGETEPLSYDDLDAKV